MRILHAINVQDI